MHARQLIEVAGTIALRSGPLLQTDAALVSDALSEYWIASRCRLDHWGRLLRRLGHSQTALPGDAEGGSLPALVEELTLSETLTRVVAAIALAYDIRGPSEEAGPIGVNALRSHREATGRLRALTFAWWPPDSSRARHARSLTRRAEHWTDMLLAYVAPTSLVESLAHDAERLHEFGYDSRTHGAESSRAAAGLLIHALRSGFTSANQPPLNAELNRRIAGAALSMFGPAGFDGHGLSRPAWMLRAERAADDTSALFARLFDDDDPPPPPTSTRLPTPWRI